MAVADRAERPRVVVVDDDPDWIRLVDRWLQPDGYAVHRFREGRGLLGALDALAPDVVLLDLHLEDVGGLDVLRATVRAHPGASVVMLTADGAVDRVVESMQAGAWDYLQKPVDPTHLRTTVRRAVERALATRARADDGGAAAEGPGGMVGASAPMLRLYDHLARVAPRDVTVLVLGESGTGKELVARALHEGSDRARGPFVALNCAAIPETLQESELFGHERGAFTGAESARPGRFEQADGGTLFLDEVAELSPSLQAKLLRVLQERSFYRLGGRMERVVDVRIVAATHRDLAADVQAGRFRHDLFYRLGVFELSVPPLRDRGGDIVHLAERFLRDHDPRLTLDPATVRLLETYPWPGNVRELENAMARAAVLVRGERILPDDLPERVQRHFQDGRVEAAPRPPAALPPVEEPYDGPPGLRPVERLERAAIRRALQAAEGNVSEAIRALGIPRTTMYRKLKRYGLR